MTQFSALTAEIRTLVSLWEPALLDLPQDVARVSAPKLSNVWLNALAEPITLEAMIRDYGLHLAEIERLIN